MLNIYVVRKRVIDRYRIFHGRRLESKKIKEKVRRHVYNDVRLRKDQKADIDSFYLQNYGRKIPQEWHRYYTAFTERFDTQYFPELLYIPEFEYFMNPYKEYNKVFEDKNILPYIAKSAGIKMPKTVLSCSCREIMDENYSKVSITEAEEILLSECQVFAKPSIDSCSGRGCIIYKPCRKTENGDKKSVDEFLKGLGNDYIIQEVIKCHPSISSIYSKSVNTFRILTFRWRNDILHAPIIMRIGKDGATVDNAHAGGMFVAVEDDGTLHDKAFTEFRTVYTEHPNSQVKFKDVVIPFFDKVIEAAKRMHSRLPQIGVVNWDFTLDINGNPVLIEANIEGGGIWVIEMAHGKGPFGVYTGEILRWIRKMEMLPVDKRTEHYFGF